MENKEHQIHRQNRFFAEKRLSIAYGFIVDMLRSQEEQDEDLEPSRYMPVVIKENLATSAVDNAVPMRFANTPDFLAANYGSPRDLIGRRVRIEYIGTDWKYGICHIVDNSFPSDMAGSNRVEGTGFIFARAGAVNE